LPPGFVFDRNAISTPLLLGAIFDFTGIEDLFEALGQWGVFDILDEVGHFALEFV
jgi:hypothetical protein